MAKDYRVMVKCILCDKEPYEIVISEIKRHTYDGCPECAKKIMEIANTFNLSDVTIRKYLRIGTDLNMCSYII